jgi:hypothetical protein
MLRSIFLNLMTFVLLIGGAPIAASPTLETDLFPPETADENQELKDVEQQLEEKGLIVSEPLEVKSDDIQIYYPYQQSMAPRLGVLIDPDLLRDRDLPLLVGITYMLPKRRAPRWEIGFDVVVDDGAHFSIGQRHIWGEPHSFRSYVKISALLAANAEEKLATITDIDNYFLKLSVGLEDVIKMPMSVRLETELVAGLERQYLIFSFGYSWGW